MIRTIGYGGKKPTDFFNELKKHMAYYGGQKTINKKRVTVLNGVKMIRTARGESPARAVIPKEDLTKYVLDKGPLATIAALADPSKGEGQDNPPDPEDQLFAEAARLLEVNGGAMEQRLFFEALVGFGYNQVQASQMLREDSRLSFRGMDVSSVG